MAINSAFQSRANIEAMLSTQKLTEEAAERRAQEQEQTGRKPENVSTPGLIPK